MKFYDQVKASADFAEGSLNAIKHGQEATLAANLCGDQFLRGMVAGTACALVLSFAASEGRPGVSASIATLIADEVLEHVRRRLAELTAARN